jgi:hypothetical protein
MLSRAGPFMVTHLGVQTLPMTTKYDRSWIWLVRCALNDHCYFSLHESRLFAANCYWLWAYSGTLDVNVRIDLSMTARAILSPAHMVLPERFRGCQV